MTTARKAPAKRAAGKSTARASANSQESAPIASAADSVDQQLASYRDMRDFGVTAEPSGGHGKAKSPSPALPFVIQKHAASHLHYDFRLGWNGVLKSWACVKGPSYNVRDRRLAVQVEDHPMEYGGFEGIIPKGQYGGGTVMVWDHGTWEPQPGHTDIDAGLRDGSLKFVMHGSKMHGKWALIRMHDKPASEGSKSRWRSSGKPNWLLIKEHDELERHEGDPAITDEAPLSAVTGRSLDQIAANEDHVWNSKETAGTGQAWYRNQPAAAAPAPVSSDPEPAPAKAPAAKRPKAARNAKAKPSAAPSDLPAEAQPTFIKPELAQEAGNPPDGSGWLHELKLDGYRVQARKSGAVVTLLTRSGLDWTHRMAAVAAAVTALPDDAVTLDGEVVVLAADGTTSFADLQASFQNDEQHPLTYFVFDLLHLKGGNTRELPLLERKQRLEAVLSANTSDALRYSEHLTTDGATMFRHACELHAEGIVSKRADSLYRSTRSADWLKSKCLHESEFVIGGYTLSSDSDSRVGSLLLGYYEGGKLVHAGRTGTGFTQKSRAALLQQLQRLARKTSSFYSISAAGRKGALWVEPKLVAQVRFATWTADGNVRQAAFLGLREDKPAAEVHREGAGSAPTPKSSHSPRKSVRSSPAKPLAATLPANLRLTHPAKIVDTQTGVTKQQLAEFYWSVAPHMLPYIADRPLSLVRCPEGTAGECFYQKHVNHTLPPGITAVSVTDKKSGKPEPYITLNSPQAVAGLAQMTVLEVHPWASTNDDLEHPDRLVFDLDPDEALPWPAVCEAALEVRDRLHKAGLTSFVKTTGGKGLHIVAPVRPELAWPEFKDVAHHFVLAMEKAKPRLYLTKMTKAARIGKIYLDYLRNERGATSVALFSPRARAGLPVSVPLAWNELTATERPVFRVADFHAWKSRLQHDPWRRFAALKQSAPQR